MSEAAMLLAGIAGKLTTLDDAKLLAVLNELASIPTAEVVPPMLNEMRPRLRQLRPRRPLTALRMLCRPFQDLLYSGAPESHGECIPRTAITHFWEALAPGRADFRAAELQLRRLSLGDAKGIFAISEKLWRLAAGIIDAKLAAGEQSTVLRLMRDALLAGPIIENFKQAVPGKPLPNLDAYAKAQFGEGVEALSREQLPVGGFLIVVAARLANPGELLAALRHRDLAVDDATRQQLQGFAATQVETEAQNFAASTATGSPGDLARAAERLLGNIAATREGGDDQLRARLDRDAPAMLRTVQTTLRERIIDAAPAALDVAMPTTGPQPTVEMLQAAEDHARALYRTRRLAGQVGLEDHAARAIVQARQRFESEISGLIATRPTDATRATTSRDVYRSIRMIELVDGPQRAHELLDAAQRKLRPPPPPEPV